MPYNHFGKRIAGWEAAQWENCGGRTYRTYDEFSEANRKSEERAQRRYEAICSGVKVVSDAATADWSKAPCVDNSCEPECCGYCCCFASFVGGSVASVINPLSIPFTAAMGTGAASIFCSAIWGCIACDYWCLNEERSGPSSRQAEIPENLLRNDVQSYQPTSSRQSEIPDNLLRNDVQSYEPTSSRQTEIPERFPNDDVQDLCELSNQCLAERDQSQ